MEYALVFGAVLVIGIVGYSILNMLSKPLSNKRFQEITVSATLSDKRIQVNESMRFGVGVQPDNERYYLIFLTKDEISFEFRVTNADFYDFEIGTVGKLTYQGSDYRGFESDQN